MNVGRTPSKPAVFVLDQASLVRNGYQIMPIDYGHATSPYGSDGHEEEEEFVLGKKQPLRGKGIYPIDRYLISVTVPPETLASIEESRRFNRWPDSAVLVKHILHHPKLNAWTPRQ